MNLKKVSMNFARRFPPKFLFALEQIDTRLMNERDRSIWEVVGFRSKTAISTFGEFVYKRRLYRDKKTGETRFFLDELLGWPARARITPT